MEPRVVSSRGPRWRGSLDQSGPFEVEPGLRLFGKRLHCIVEGAGRTVGLDPEGDEDLVGDTVARVCQNL
jgi:hypothetical protein